MTVTEAAALISSYLASGNIQAARQMAQTLSPRDLPNGSDPSDPQLVAALKLRSLAAEVLDYVGAFQKARNLLEDTMGFCEIELQDIDNWERSRIDDSRHRLHQEIWLLLHAGLSEYRIGSYDRALSIFDRCNVAIEFVAPPGAAHPRWATKARIAYSLGLVSREKHELEEALSHFTRSTEFAYRSLNHHAPAQTDGVSWLTSIAIARSLGMGLASVHDNAGRTDLAMPLLLASKAMLPSDEILISTHLDLQRFNIRRSTILDASQMSEVIDGLRECHATFCSENHALYRARAAYCLIRAYLHRSSLGTAQSVAELIKQCEELFRDLDVSRSGDRRFHLSRLAVRSWMERQRGTEANYREAEQIAERGLKEASRTHHPYVFMELCLARGKARERLSNLRGAAEDYRSALDAACAANNLRQRAIFLLHLSRIYWQLGNKQLAAKHHDNYLELRDIARIRTADVVRLEKTVDQLFERRDGDFYIGMREDIPDPDQKFAELRGFLVRWAKQDGATDKAAADRLGKGRGTFAEWKRESKLNEG
jgi:tetratricopeptide (TPR) repeat protein